MSDLLLEENLNRARSLLARGKEQEASDLLNLILKKFPQNKKVQHVLQYLQKVIWKVTSRVSNIPKRTQEVGSDNQAE